MMEVLGSLTYGFEEIEEILTSFLSDLFGIEPHMRSHHELELFMGVVLLRERGWVGGEGLRTLSWSWMDLDGWMEL